MKKAIVLLLALGMIATFAVAQDAPVLAFSGYERANVTINDAGAALANRVRLNLSAKGEDGLVGFWGRLQFANFDAADTELKYAYAWAKLADKMITVTGGKLANYDYTLGSGVSEYYLGNVSNSGYNLDSAIGLLVQFYPVAGLDVGVGFLPSGALGLGDFLFGVKYAIEGVGDVIVEGSLADAVADSRLTASFNFTGVENLGVSVGYKGILTHGVYAIIDYAMGDLSVQVAPEVADFSNISVYVEGCVNYKIDPVTIRALGSYDTGASTYFAGLELLYTFGKAQLRTGFTYDGTWAIPLTVKVSF